MRRAAASPQSMSMVIAGSGEFFAVAVLLIAGALGHFVGGTPGIFVGLALGLALFITALAGVSWAEKAALLCECTLCHKQFAYHHCTRKNEHEG